MVTALGFGFPLLFGFSIGMLLSYLIVVKRSTRLTIDGIAWPIDLSGNEREPTMPGVITNADQIFSTDNQLHEGISAYF